MLHNYARYLLSYLYQLNLHIYANCMVLNVLLLLQQLAKDNRANVRQQRSQKVTYIYYINYYKFYLACLCVS